VDKKKEVKFGGNYFGWRPNNEFVWGEVNLSVYITTERNKTAETALFHRWKQNYFS